MKLTNSFLEELFKLFFNKKSMLQVAAKHIKYSFIPKELGEYKAIYQSIINQWELTGKLPSIGVVSQQHSKDPNVQEALKKIKNADFVDEEVMLDTLETYIKNTELILLNEKIVELNEKGQLDKAVELNAQEGQRINSISLRNDSGKFLKLFGDFHSENLERQKESEEDFGENEKVPFSILPLDDLTYGGIDVGETALWIMRSGIGKSTALKWTGLKAAMLGYNVLHFQLEGSEKEARDKYTQIFTQQAHNIVKNGSFSREIMVKVEKLLKQMEQAARDVYIYAFEKFGDPTMIDIRELVLEYHKITGVFPHLIVIDSLDLVATGENKKVDTDPAYKKEKLQRCAQLMKNMVSEFKPSRILTATQTSDVSPDIWNDPDKVITRSHTEGDRTLVKSFSYVFTGNVTNDEQAAKKMRIYADKLRNYNPKDKIYPICTAYDVGAFCNPIATKKLYSKSKSNL